MDPEALLDAVKAWAAARSDVLGLALVGSRARGEERPDSDVDLVLLSAEPDAIVAGDWFRQFGKVRSFAVERYGVLRVIRVFYEDGPEVEFGVVSREWARLPLDPGTATVLAGGFRALYDPEGLLGRLSVPRS